MLVRPAQCRYSFEQAQFLQHPRGVGPEHHTRADLAELGSPLVDCRFNARAVERHSRGNAANSAADDADI